ncbi:hypothetical protein R3P38DRAFT_3224405 [Favolaschia claudopus]|uniref:Uncharacterized protein n=1 Tax=Favolaschia claudopus TaxID=2862362 RepID=A0AAV9ZW37_9AGAR
MRSERGWRAERDYLAEVCLEFHARIPWRLEDSEEPELPLAEYDPVAIPVAEELDEEEVEMKRLRVETLNARIGRWMKYRARRLRKPTISDPLRDPWALLLAKLVGITPAHKARQGYQQYMHESYATDIDPIVQARWKARPVTEDGTTLKTKGIDANFRAEVARELFRELPTEEQEAIRQRARDEAQRDKEEYVRQMRDLPSKKPEDRQRCIDNLGQFMTNVLRGVYERTGLSSFAVFGGPMPAFGGDLRTVTVSYGVNDRSAGGCHFPQWVKPRFGRDVLDFMKEWLKTAYSQEACQEAAMPFSVDGQEDDPMDENENLGWDDDDDSESSSSGSEDSGDTDIDSDVERDVRALKKQTKAKGKGKGGKRRSGGKRTTRGTRGRGKAKEKTDDRGDKGKGKAKEKTDDAGERGKTKEKRKTDDSGDKESGKGKEKGKGKKRKSDDADNASRKKRKEGEDEERVRRKRKAEEDGRAPSKKARADGTGASAGPSQQPVQDPVAPPATTPSPRHSPLPSPPLASPPPSPDNERLPQVDTPECPDDAATWFREVYPQITFKKLGDNFNALLVALTELERAYKWEKLASGLGTTSRPTQIYLWVRAGRGLRGGPMSQGAGPTIGSVVKFEQTWWAWWEGLQPPWRKREPGIPKRFERVSYPEARRENWESLRAPGPNGALNLVASLYWWGVKLIAVVDSEEKRDWVEAVTDLKWMLRGLCAAENSLDLV